LKTIKGICLSREICPLSSREEVITVDAGDPFVCPVCRSVLKEVQLQKVTGERQTGSLWVMVAFSLAALALIVFTFNDFHLPGKLLPGFGGVAESHSKVLLRLAGSNTIGENLGPALAEAYLRVNGAKDVYVKDGDGPDVKAVFGILPGSSNPVEIDIAAHGSATAFTSLGDGSCDIGMASRRVNAGEVAKLAALGTMTDADNEHILGLDGIAIIVNAHNPLNEISKDRLQRIFAGQDDQWKSGAVINIYARDDKSGTYDTFKNLVLAGKPLAKTAKRFEDSNALSDAVANDPNGIGFIGLPYIRNAKALAVSDAGTKPLLPTPLTVATEDYALSRRLYLYTPASSDNPRVREFVEFAMSPEGQQVVAANSFVVQTAQQMAQKAAPDAPPEYLSLTANAERMPIDFRFLADGTELDSRAFADLDRVVAQLAKAGSANVRVLLFGFSDNSGSSLANQVLSLTRARAVADELSRRGVTPAIVGGFGSALPVASNDTLEGREKNRRVEIWINEENTVADAQ